MELEGDNAADTMQLRPVDPQQPAPPASPATEGAPTPASPATEGAPTLATPPASAATTPSAQDLSLFEPAAAPADWDDTRSTSPRHRRTILLCAGGALVAVLALGLASGVFTYDAPSRKNALPQNLRASVPVPSSSESETGLAPTETATRPVPPPTSASPTESPNSLPSPTRSTTSPAPTRSTEPAKTRSTTDTAAGSGQGSSAERQPPVLSRGDRGPEVTELELRLTQLGLYRRQAGGYYSEDVEVAVARYQWARGIQPENYGVYDLETRERLESETTEP